MWLHCSGLYHIIFLWFFCDGNLVWHVLISYSNKYRDVCSLRLPVGIMWSVICGVLWLYVWQQPDPAVVPFYDSSVYWFCISSFIEILVQPIAVVGQILLFVEVKVSFLGIIEIVNEQWLTNNMAWSSSTSASDRLSLRWLFRSMRVHLLLCLATGKASGLWNVQLYTKVLCGDPAQPGITLQ